MPVAFFHVRHTTALMGAAVATMILLTACSPETPAPSAETAANIMSTNDLQEDLELLARSRVFFGHHSVGVNILDGVKRLAENTGVALRVEEVKPGAIPASGPGLFHGRVGENHDPDGKIAAFSAAMGETGESRYDLAMLKFCYVDLNDNSREQKADELFQRYLDGMDGIRAAHPELVLLNSTMPLYAEPPGKKTRLKRLLGMAVDTDEHNVRRNEYNRLVREHFSTAELFDVARLEATAPDGSIVTFSSSGQPMEMLAQEFTDDGGHLNDSGQDQVAAEFVHRLAEALRQVSAEP